MKEVIALDIGGTKIHGGLVREDGRIIHELKVPVHLQQGPDGFFEQLANLIQQLSSHGKTKFVGIGCAGPLDGEQGLLLDPTNFFTDGKSWGVIDLFKPLKARLPSFDFLLDNDAAAAVLAEARWGQSGLSCVVAMTLGTGVGVGVIVDGKLVRTRGQLHPEVSHIPLNFTDTEAPCGCGNFGCMEAYLSGTHHIRRLQKKWNIPKLDGPQLIGLLEAKDPRALASMREYAEWMAQSVAALAVLYGPQHVSLSGGFATTASWFLPQARMRLEVLLRRRREHVDFLPTLAESKLGSNLGLLGAACVGLQHK